MWPRGLELRPDHDVLLLVRGTRAIVVSELKSLRSLGESRRSMIAVTSKVNGELWNTAKKARAGKTAEIHARRPQAANITGDLECRINGALDQVSSAKDHAAWRCASMTKVGWIWHCARTVVAGSGGTLHVEPHYQAFQG